jgi:glycosyltransferase involved in cell wall biosynthesis
MVELNINSIGESDKSIVYISTFPPRKCGIATFTEDLTNAMDTMLVPLVKSKIVAMNPGGGVDSYRYPRKVTFQINEDNPEEYSIVARKINGQKEVKLVCIQHEFGIFGGKLGTYIIPLLEELNKPVVITFHTVLPDPDESLLNTVQSLAHSANAVIVMTKLSKDILVKSYTVQQDKIKVIPHGIHAQPFTLSQKSKMSLGYSDRIVLSSFGLISRNKGYEFVIQALSRVVKEYPDFVYLIVGATHPGVLAKEGESYRNYLIQLISDLDLYDHVKLYNRYFPLNELLHFLKATDIYLSPSLDPNQAVSGTLSYALGMGRPVISTAFSQAREVISDEVGLLVDFRNPESYADAIRRLLEDSECRRQMGKTAYFRTRNMVWSNVALQYIRVFSDHSPDFAQIVERKSLPNINLNHLSHLTDNFGIVQFANLTRRDTSSGYTLDDNTRALAVTVLYYEKLNSLANDASTAKNKELCLKLIDIYFSFVQFVAHPEECFQNFVGSDKQIDTNQNGQVNLEESNARTLYSLSLTSMTSSLPKRFRTKAFQLLQERLSNDIGFYSPRAIAWWIKALCILKEAKKFQEEVVTDSMITEQCELLVDEYNRHGSDDWQWFEELLAYSNGILPEALLLGYRATANAKYLEIGKTTLDFLIKESYIEGIFMPIGQSGWRYRNGKRHYFDQQPEEITAIVYALKAGYNITGDEEYRRLMYRAFNWFLGDNTLNQVVYDRTTGGCYDGIGRKEVNLNQGAESTISCLLARLAFD